MERPEAPPAPPLPLSAAEFSALARRHARPLHAFLCGLVRDREQAHDLTQDAFCAAWEAAQRATPPFVAGGPEVNMRRWLYRVAYRRAIDVRRRGQVIQWETLPGLDDSALDEQLAVGAFDDMVVEREAMERALGTLGQQDAACLLLLVVHGFTAVEAARILDASPEAVAKRLARAKQRLLVAYRAENTAAVEERR
jgi:RNA polymerase sigma-70 factor (ECF subfamily)